MKSLFLMAVVLVMPLAGPAQTAGGGSARVAAVQQARYYRTELYMGRSIPGGGEVSDQDWEEFLSDTVTTRFPEGFTVLTGRGQWREASGKVAKELSQVLVFLYKKADRKPAGAKIDEIKREYIRRFRQEAVIRIDFGRTVLVAF
jgi:hypothetical protein